MSMMLDRDTVKAAARGREVELLTAIAGIPVDLLDGKHHHCPRTDCGGVDRFRLIDPDDGAVLCNECFHDDNGDWIAAAQHYAGLSFLEVLAQAADYLGLRPHSGNAVVVDFLERLCRAKRMPRAAAIELGARVQDGAIVFPSWDENGEPLSDFTIWLDGSDKQRKGMWPKGGRAGLFLPVVDAKPRKPQPGEVWPGAEGPKDGAALLALYGKAFGMPTCRLNQRFVSMFRGVHVVLVPDLDGPSIEGMEQAARRLCRVAASVKIARLPGEVLKTKGQDVRDVMAKPDGEQLVRQAIDEAREWKLPAVEGIDNRPRILVSAKDHEVADAAIAALAMTPGVYQRGGALVGVVKDPPPPPGIKRPQGAYYICPLDLDGICDQLSKASQFYVMRARGKDLVEADVSPPLRIARIVRSRHELGSIPPIEAIIHAPAFLADGSVLTRRGYDRSTGLYLAGDTEFPSIPELPTLADAEVARDELMEVFCDFPFASEAHRAAALAMAIGPAARFAVDGPFPLEVIESNVRGSGKSLMVDSISMIHYGTQAARTTPPTDDVEFQKVITATLLGAEPLMLLDNVAESLGCKSLDALLTARTWKARILGESKNTAALQANTIWMATGNNITYRCDTSRRALGCRIESKEENPEEREGFRHPNQLAWVQQHRARLAVAAVTILKAYHVAGRPRIEIPQWGSFEAWSDLVRSAVVWVGMEDPGATRVEVREQSDLEGGLLRQLLAAWESADPSGGGLTVQEAIDRAAKGNELMQLALAEMGQRGKPPSPRSIGMKLHHLKRRVAGGLWFEREQGPGHTVVWRVATPDDNRGTKGTEGTISNPPACEEVNA